MQPANPRDAQLLYVECLAIGKFSKRRWNGPAIDESVYDFSDSDLPGGPINMATTSGSSWDLEAERTTLPKAVVSGEVLSTLRQWWMTLRTGTRSAC